MSTKQLLVLLISQIDGDEEQVLAIPLLHTPHLDAVAEAFTLPPARQVPSFLALSLR